jgi:hypothetical protein
MRIGECVDLSYDCLRAAGPNQWAIHVPLGKLKTERMVPVDTFGRDLVHRLRFFRSLDPSACRWSPAGSIRIESGHRCSAARLPA